MLAPSLVAVAATPRDEVEFLRTTMYRPDPRADARALEETDIARGTRANTSTETTHRRSIARPYWRGAGLRTVRRYGSLPCFLPRPVDDLGDVLAVRPCPGPGLGPLVHQELAHQGGRGPQPRPLCDDATRAAAAGHVV